MTQEPNKCCGAFYGCDKCKNKQVYLDKLAEDYLLSSVERNQYGDELSFIDGYKLAQKTLYSEEDMRTAHLMGANFAYGRKEATKDDRIQDFNSWFQKFKNK
jgi:hypothetical protein